jgi:hypothetical protein
MESATRRSSILILRGNDRQHTEAVLHPPPLEARLPIALTYDQGVNVVHLLELCGQAMIGENDARLAYGLALNLTRQVRRAKLSSRLTAWLEPQGPLERKQGRPPCVV